MHTPKRKNSPIKLEDIYDLNVTIMNQTMEIRKEVAELKTLTGNIEHRTKMVEEDCGKLRERADKCESQLNAMAQLNLRKRMEIKGVPQSDLVNVKDWKKYVIELLRKFSVVCEESKIEKAYKWKVDTANPFQLIIVWFHDETEKDRIMWEKFDNQKKHKIKSEIYLNHCLTKYNRALYTKALKVKSEIGMEKVFVKNGKIKMKQNKQSEAVVVRNFEDIEKLCSSALENQHE